MTNSEIKNCSQCGEDAICVSWDGKNIVRVRRVSKCKKYRSRRGFRTCSTLVYAEKRIAVERWNERQG